MRKLSALFLFTILIACTVVPCVGMTQQQESPTAQRDSTIDVIGWFYKNDTLTYWIQEDQWKIKYEDTIQLAGVSTKVMITVTDSTAAGYKMNYTFLDVIADSIDNSPAARLSYDLTTLLGKKIIGTTIGFETDDCGKIVKFNNIRQIKNRAKSMFNDIPDVIGSQPWAQELNAMGYDMKKLAQRYIKSIDTDIMIDSYLDDIKLIFRCHGLSYEAGEIFNQEPGSETNYAYDSYQSATMEEHGRYQLLFHVVNKVPKSAVKELAIELASSLKDAELTEKINNDFESELKNDGMISSYLQFDYMAVGWPRYILQQNATLIDNYGKVKEKTIIIESYK